MTAQHETQAKEEVMHVHEVQAALYAERELDTEIKALLWAMCSARGHINYNTGVFWGSKEDLRLASGMKPRRFAKWWQRLKACGWIDIQERTGQTSVMTLVIPEYARQALANQICTPPSSDSPNLHTEQEDRVQILHSPPVSNLHSPPMQNLHPTKKRRIEEQEEAEAVRPLETSGAHGGEREPTQAEIDAQAIAQLRAAGMHAMADAMEARKRAATRTPDRQPEQPSASASPVDLSVESNQSECEATESRTPINPLAATVWRVCWSSGAAQEVAYALGAPEDVSEPEIKRKLKIQIMTLANALGALGIDEAEAQQYMAARLPR